MMLSHATNTNHEDMERLTKELRDLSTNVHPPVPNPAPLGLFAFGLTTALLQIKHTRLGGDDPEDLEGVEVFVLGFAMFFGGFLQIIAGISEIRRNNIFGYTAFLFYGGFWMSVALVDIIQLLAADHATAPNPKVVQAMLFLVGVFSGVLWLCTFKMNKTINVLFFLLTCTLFLLTAGVRNETIDIVAGWFGIVTSATAYWLGAAEILNDILGEGKKTIIPLGHFHWNENAAHGAFQAPGRIQPAPVHSTFLKSTLNSLSHSFRRARSPGTSRTTSPQRNENNPPEKIPEEDIEIQT